MIPVESQAALAAKAIKHITKSGMHLSIAYNLLAGHLSMKRQGVDVEKLPPVKPCLQICQNKIVDMDTPDQRLV